MLLLKRCKLMMITSRDKTSAMALARTVLVDGVPAVLGCGGVDGEKRLLTALMITYMT
jgi:hypothetical protein